MHTHVYFIMGAGMTKIGVSTNVEQRFVAISAMSPVPLELVGYFPGTWRDENALHLQYAEFRSHGEWFRFVATPQWVDDAQQWCRQRKLDAQTERERERTSARSRAQHRVLRDADVKRWATQVAESMRSR